MRGLGAGPFGNGGARAPLDAHLIRRAPKPTLKGFLSASFPTKSGGGATLSGEQLHRTNACYGADAPSRQGSRAITTEVCNHTFSGSGIISLHRA
jgi:hypothetical protein